MTDVRKEYFSHFFSYIGSFEFISTVGLFSSKSQRETFILKDKFVDIVISHCKSNISLVWEILEEIHRICSFKTDEQHEHQYDTPLSVLLLILKEVDLHAANYAAVAIQRYNFNNLFWCRKVCDDLLLRKQTNLNVALR